MRKGPMGPCKQIVTKMLIKVIKWNRRKMERLITKETDKVFIKNVIIFRCP